jgi:hypothetical protein
MSAAATASAAAKEAVARAARGVEGPKLAIVFVSATYPDLDAVLPSVTAALGPIPVVGGTSARCVVGPDGTASPGVSVVVLGGTGIEVFARTVSIRSPALLELVPVAEELAREAERAARRGHSHHSCLVFAPSLAVDGEALVAAVRRGAGARAQLVGALTGDELTMDRSRVFADGELRNDRVTLASLVTRRPLGIAARHGWHSVGPVHTVTRADGVHLLSLDHRRALDVWLEDVRREGGNPPSDLRELASYLTNEFLLGVDELARSGAPSAVDDPVVVRAPLRVGPDGGIRLSGSVPEGTHVRLVHSAPRDLLDASARAASAAALRAGPPVAGALVLACASRVAALGACFAEEPAEIQRRIGAPIGGACVYGEIARNVRDVDAFFNTTTVVLAFGT